MTANVTIQPKKYKRLKLQVQRSDLSARPLFPLLQIYHVKVREKRTAKEEIQELRKGFRD